jgi:predicted outer membrane repeat protein
MSTRATNGTAATTGLNVVVNTLGDAADTNVGDGQCDTDANAGNECTLRAAIQETNFAMGSDSIDFALAPGSTITLNTALPDISGNLTITGPGANQLTVMRSTAGGTANFRIFTIPQFATASISGLTISNGRLSTNQAGGGVSNRGTLTMSDCNVYGNNLNPVNFDAGGGGIFNAGSMTLNNCNIGGIGPGQGNGTDDEGGGISEFGTMVMRGGSIVGNIGAGISVTNSLGGTTLIGVKISNNSVFGGAGGVQVNGAITLIDCLISNNSAVVGGGGINSEGADVLVVNTTISGNSSTQEGGGIRQANNGHMRLVNVTITDNHSDFNNNGAESGGGIANQFGTINLTNIIVADNFRGSGSSTADDISGIIDSTSSFNLIGDGGAGGLTNGVNNNQVGVADPKLGPLTDNGGLTMTHALLTGSLAIDAASNAEAIGAGITTDQRGFARFIDGPDANTIATVDVGAYELQLPFAEIGDTTVNEDITAIVAFEVEDPGSITAITATSSNATLIPNSPDNITTKLSHTTGSVTLRPAANLFGTSNITVTVTRTGSSTSRMFQLTVNSSNDAPSFVKGDDQIVNEDSSAQTVNSWATAISPGPSDEVGQIISFTITNNNNQLFSTQPAISSNGILTYTPASNAAGFVTVSVTLSDDGGTANGGQNTSPVQTFTITINQVNDAPSFTKGPDQTVNNDAGLQAVSNWATNISVGPPNEIQGFFFAITENTNPGLFVQQPSINASGRLTYRPSSSAGGSATITVILHDTGGTANGGVDQSAPQAFNITVVPVGGFLKLSSASINTSEGSGSTTITVERTGDSSRAVAVQYATSGANGLPCSTLTGMASSKCDFTSALGTLEFAAGETIKTFVVLISQDSFFEGPETLMLGLTNPTNLSALGLPATATLTIDDDITEPATNVIDDPTNFVRQHYHDFLNREPDAGGLAFWTNEITSCGTDPQCIEIKRINVSAAFFLSIEFENTGYLVYRMFKTAYGDTTSPNVAVPVPIIRLNEFLPDAQRIGQGVRVGIGDWEAQLEANKNAYAREFVVRQRFLNEYPLTMTPAQFVDKLNLNAGGVLSQTERDQLIAALSIPGDITFARAMVLRKIAEDADLRQQETNRAFVLMQYYGYMRRNPDDPQDTDFRGWEFWLNKLNQFNGNFIQAEMVKAFISSIEYRQRFGP